LGAFAANSPAAGWSGLYAGASFGIGGLHGSTRSRYQSVSTDSSTFQSVDPTTGLVDFQSASTGSSVYDAADTSRNKRNAIALADFYAGYNVDIGNNIVAGVQAEGTLSRGTVKMPGRGSSTSTDTGTNVSSGFGPPVTTTSLSLDSDTYTFTDQLSLEWMVSALARVGWADAQNYVYAVGGWSYGKFSLGGPGMGLHGPTGGFGWERKLTSNWSIRGEYRYTKFLPRTFGEQDVFSSTSTSSETDGTSSTFSFNETSGSTTRLSADIHALRFGIAHYFGAY
jgi:opacity protein-like surface antigen